MNRVLLPVAVVFGTSSLLLVDSAIKGGDILTLAAFVANLSRRDSAATRHRVWLAAIALILGASIAIPIAMLRAANEPWNPPSATHVGGNDFSAYCVHGGKDASFVIAYDGDFGSATSSDSNPKTRTWTDSGTITAKKPGIALSFHRTHTAPGKLSITTAPAEGRDLSKPAPPRRDFGQKEYDLAKGRVFLLSDHGNVRQLDIATPVVTDQASAKQLAALIAAIPPQEREDVALTTNLTGKLAPETIAKLKWGEPVNGLRMALAYPPALGDALLGKKPHFELVVQNVAEKEIHFLASDEAPNPRELVFRAENRTVLVLGDEEVSAADWHLQPGHCGILRMFTLERQEKDGKTIGTVVEGDLSKIDRNQALAIMEIAKAPPGAWTGKLVTGPTRGSADVAAAPAPMHKDARALYEIWQRYARANGDIPGALVDELAAAVKTFIRYNPTWATVPKLNELLPRLDATHDWKPADAIPLLDEVAGIQDSPLKGAVEKATRSSLRKGDALPNNLADAPWGDAQPNGLRAAWVLEPGGAEHRIGAALRARLLVQNRGQVAVMLQVPTWHQGWVKASDANGKEVEASGLEWTTLAQLFPCRLAPGEYIEINTPGVGFGPRAGMGPWAGPRVGSNVLAKPGDELTLTHSLVPLDGSEVGVSEDDPRVSGPGWWLAHIKTRLNRELPLPTDAAERTRLLDRAVRELFATAPSAEETAMFIADQTPDALDALAKRLVARVDVVSFSGKLPTAPAKFRVIAADANADKQPRVVLGPGEYPLSKGTAESGVATLKIVGRSVGDRHTNDAQILFEATEATGKLPPEPHKLEVPDGRGTWAIVCRPSDGFFYLLHNGTVRKIDYSAPRNVTDTPADDLPAEFRDEVKRILDIHEISAAQQAEFFEKPAAPAATPDSKTGAHVPASDEALLKPKHESAQSLFQKWQKSARTDGKIPGALIGHVAREMDNFLKRYPADEKAPKLAALRPRCDASHDWTQAEVVALLDDITAISTAPVSWADLPMVFGEYNTVKPGQPLPAGLNSAAWGEPAANGLRAAWLLEPAPLLVDTGGEAFPTTENVYQHGSVLKARVLFHNAGKAPVVFRTETWHQVDAHTARDAKGAEIKVTSTFFTGITPMAIYRLLPGEYCEVGGHGIAIGAGKYEEEHSTGSVGAVIEAMVGDEVSLSHTVDAAMSIQITNPDDPKAPAELWRKIVAERVGCEAPVPKEAADRAQLIRRVMLDLLGELPSTEEVEAFTAESAPDPLEKLVERILAKPHIEPWTGKLPTGETKFRVIAADPNAAKAPRTANAPGRCELGDKVHLQITQTNVNPYRVGSVPFLQNKSTIIFSSPAPEAVRGPKPYEIVLPNGIGTYGIVWERGAGVLWVLQRDLARKYDFTNPWKVQETRFAEGGIINIPEHLREAMKKAFDVPDAPVQQPASEKPTQASTPKQPKLTDDAYARLGVHSQKFREEDAKRPGGELMGAVLEPSKPEGRDKEPLVLGVRTASDAQGRIGGTAKVGLVVRNRTGGIGRNQPGSDVKFSYTGRLDNGLSVVAVDEAGKEHGATIAHFDGELGFQHMLLPVAHVASIKEFTVRFDAEKRGVSEPRVAAFHLPPGKYKLRCKWNDARPDVAHEGEWTGELVNEELTFTLAAAAAPASETRKTPAATESPPKTPVKEPFTAWGKEIGGLQAGLGFKAGGKRAFSHGEKVKLVVRVRNVGKEEAKFDYIPEHFIENPPAVLDEKAKAVSLARGLVDTGAQIGREANLAPGEEIELAELTLEFSSRNEAGTGFKKSLTIYGTGKFQVGFENVLGTGFIKPDPALSKLATGKLELEIREPEKLPSEKETPTSPSNAAAASEKPKPNYVTVVGQLLDDETGQPIEKAGWEWGMADPQKPDQISWGHSRLMGKSHPDGKFEMPLNISANGNHYPLRVYAAGYETTVVVDELAKPYPEKIERNIRLKRGRSITGVLRDHTGNPVANGWVFFIPKGYQTNIVESIPGTDAHQLPVNARDGAVSEVRTNENGTFSLPTGVAGTLAASTDLVDLWPFPLPVDGYAELKMPAPSYLVIDLTYWYLDELAQKEKRAISPNSEDPNQCWIQVDQSGSSEPLWKNLGYRRQMLVFAKDPRATLSKGVIVGHVVEGEMDKPIPDIGHNKNLSTKIRVALPPGNYRVQRMRTGPFTPVDEQNVELKSGEDTILSWARGDGSSVRGKATWPANMMFVRQQGEAPRKLDWTVPFTATVWIAPVGVDGKDGKPIDAAKIQADGSFFVPTNLDPGKYKATARVSLPESDDSLRSSGWRGPDCIATAEFTVPDPARGPFGSPPVELEIKMEVAENVRFLRSNAPADPPQAVQPPAGKAEEPFTAWGREVDGLQAGLAQHSTTHEGVTMAEEHPPDWPKIVERHAERVFRIA